MPVSRSIWVGGPAVLSVRLALPSNTSPAFQQEISPCNDQCTHSGHGLFWWQVCPVPKASWASFWQGFPRQMYAKVLRTSSKCPKVPEAVTGEQLAPRGRSRGCHTLHALLMQCPCCKPHAEQSRAATVHTMGC